MSPKNVFQSIPSSRIDPSQPGKHDYPYWMVWARRQGPAKFRHRTAVAAYEEAARLADLNRGRRYYVLCVIGSCKLGSEMLAERQMKAV